MSTRKFSSVMFHWPLIRTVTVCLLLTSLPAVVARGQILRAPFPEPSTNAALHYNRAILLLTMVPVEDRVPLEKPIWEAFGDASREEIDKTVAKLVYDTRHVLHAALRGARQQQCEFGIDYADFGHGNVLPHTQPMLQIGRLVTLAAIHAQIHEQWEKAAVLMFQSLRMGRHMTSQPTLVESLVGLEMLENNYYALAFWGSKCPDVRLVKQAFLRLEVGSRLMAEPVVALANEASIIQRQIEQLKAAYPEGAWGEMLCEALGENAAADNLNEQRDKAKQVCIQRGVPAKVFTDKAAFDAMADKIAQTQMSYLTAGAACMHLPPKSRAMRAKVIMESFQDKFKELGDQQMLDLQKIGSFFAAHQAEQTMARVALAVAASRTEQGFPASLESIAAEFSGEMPTSPYDGAPLQYTVLNGGKDFSVAIPAASADGIEFPRVEFSSLRE